MTAHDVTAEQDGGEGADPDTAARPRLQRIWQGALRLRDVTTTASPASRRSVMGLALVVFVVATWLAVDNFPDTGHPIAWGLIALATIVGAPLAVVLNAMEYRAMARAVGHPVGLGPALRVTVLGSAANMLPLPGSTLVRMQAMTSMGATTRAAASTSLLTGLVWVGSTGILAGAGQLLTGEFVAGVVATLAGLGLTGAGLMLLARRGAGVFRSVAPRLVTIELLFVLVAGFRLYFILRGLQIEVNGSDALGLTVAAAVATSAGVFPAGLGLREALTGAISAGLGLPAVAGVAASIIDRIARMVLLAGLAGVFMVAGRRETRADQAESTA